MGKGSQQRGPCPLNQFPFTHSKCPREPTCKPSEGAVSLLLILQLTKPEAGGTRPRSPPKATHSTSAPATSVSSSPAPAPGQSPCLWRNWCLLCSSSPCHLPTYKCRCSLPCSPENRTLLSWYVRYKIRPCPRSLGPQKNQLTLLSLSFLIKKMDFIQDSHSQGARRCMSRACML